MPKESLSVRSGLEGHKGSPDLRTIRRRVEGIKKGWSEAERLSRSVEGIRRRKQLESMLWDNSDESLLSQDCCAKSCNSKDFGPSLVG
jgi:hypothetical protein